MVFRGFLFALIFCGNLAAQKWAMQYFFDEDGKTFRIVDLAFPSAERGIAVGTIVHDDDDKKPAFTAMVTSDGGAHWANVPLTEFPRSIFFLNDSEGWMVTTNAIWHTQESGRSWQRIADQPKPNRKLDAAPSGGLITRTWFLDAKHGFAVGYQKSVFETNDGGKTWTPVAEAAKPEANPAFSVYTSIAFADQRRGLIAGGYVPAERGSSDGPEWMTPQRAKRRTVPRLAFEMDTRDGGANWFSSTAPVFGTITSVRLAGNFGLGLLRYDDAFAWPSEVQRIDTKTGKSDSVFKRKDRDVTSALLFPDGRAFLGAVEPAGMLRSVPIPGRVKILSVRDLAQAQAVPDTPSQTASANDTWTEMAIDYRAVATNVTLAGPDPEHVWAATDTGMILRWTSGK